MASGKFSSPTGWDLLWTNTAPTSNFVAQTVQLDLSDYVEIKIVFKTFTSSVYTTTYFCEIGGSVVTEYLGNTVSSGAVALWARDFMTSSSGVEFTDARTKAINGTDAPTTNYTAMIPHKIYAR